MADIVIAEHQAGAIAPVELADQTRAYILGSMAANTRRAYQSDWAHFVAWCEAGNRVSLPALPETVADYLAVALAALKPATIQRRISSISQAHQAAGIETPTKTAIVRKTWAGIRRAKSTAQIGKAPLLTEDIQRMVAETDDSLMGIRDRALLLLGFAGAFRRSELVALEVADLEATSAGLVVHVRRSKTDQDGKGSKKGIPHGRHEKTCPVRALVKWQEAGRITAGPLFRSIDRHGNIATEATTDKTVARVVKRLAIAAGLDPALYSGHSLRAGLATQAAISGSTEESIMRATGHRSVLMVRRYVRDGNLFRDNAAGAVGL